MAALVRGSVIAPLALARRARGARALIPVVTHFRCISTSQKKSEVGVPSISELVRTDKDFSKPETETWLSEGFDIEDKEYDRSVSSLSFFCTVTLCLTVGCFYFAYIPDFALRDWGTREAYLELRRRESQGLPQIDSNYVDPATVVLPSEEDLGDTEIIL